MAHMLLLIFQFALLALSSISSLMNDCNEGINHCKVVSFKDRFRLRRFSFISCNLCLRSLISCLPSLMISWRSSSLSLISCLPSLMISWRYSSLSLIACLLSLMISWRYSSLFLISCSASLIPAASSSKRSRVDEIPAAALITD